MLALSLAIKVRGDADLGLMKCESAMGVRSMRHWILS